MAPAPPARGPGRGQTIAPTAGAARHPVPVTGPGAEAPAGGGTTRQSASLLVEP